MTRPALLSLLAPFVAGCCAAWLGSAHCPSTFIPHAFSERYLCPEDRISTRERPDLPYRRFVCPGAEGCEEQRPPAEAAGDPERLALWRRITYERPGSRLDDRATATLEVTGCGERRFYACSRVYRKGTLFTHCEGPMLLDLGSREP